MSRLTRRVRSDVSPMILKLMNLEEVPTECIEVIGTDSKTCDEVCRENQCCSCVLSAVFEKLAHYEDLEEQGRLVGLPCAVGDTVYEVQEIRKRIQEYTVISVHYSHCSILFGWELKDGKGIYSNLNGFEESAIGKTIFFTPEAAEAKLAELEGAE